MTEPYLGEIQILGFSYPPYHWAFASGQMIPIQQNSALYALIGIMYGGNGTTNFQLPNLVSRQACGSGQGPGLSQRSLGETFGQYAVALNTSQMPPHNHGMNVFPSGDTETEAPAANSGIGAPAAFNMYAPPPGTPAVMSPMFVQPAGAGQPHPNVQPYLGLNYSIALSGVFPSFD